MATPTWSEQVRSAAQRNDGRLNPPPDVGGEAAPQRRILYLIYDLERGGPELRLVDLARRSPADLRTEVCVTSARLALGPTLERLGVSITVLPIGRPYIELGALWRIRRHIAGRHYRVINLFDLKGCAIATLPWRVRDGGRRPALVFHSVNAPDALSPVQRRALVAGMNACDAIVCNSEFSRRLVQGQRLRADMRIEVIYNGVDTDTFDRNDGARRAARAAYGFDDGTAVLGTVANFRPQKNYPFLIEAFGRLLASHPRLRLLCVGGGPLLEETKQRALTLGLSEKVAFAGDTADVAGHLAAMDLFALCSSWEGLPNAVLQAMACGLPVVVSAVGGCPELVNHGADGLLFTSGDRAGFDAAVNALIGDAALAARLGRAGRDKVRRRFSLAAMVEEYSCLYRSV